MPLVSLARSLFAIPNLTHLVVSPRELALVPTLHTPMPRYPSKTTLPATILAIRMSPVDPVHPNFSSFVVKMKN